MEELDRGRYNEGNILSVGNTIDFTNITSTKFHVINDGELIEANAVPPPLSASEMKICRLCGTVSDTTFDVFDYFGCENKLAEKINKYLPITVYETDPLPKTVCKVCVNILITFHTLFKQCLLTEAQLQSDIYQENSNVGKVNEETNSKMDKNKRSFETDCQKTVTAVNNCKICNKQLKSFEDCLRHCQQHEDDCFICVLCEKLIDLSSDLEEHVKQHFINKFLSQGIGLNSRDKCKQRQQVLLKQRLKYFKKLHKCQICNTVLINVDVAMEHWVKHTGDETLACVLCADSFNKSNIKQHLYIHYPLNNKTSIPVQCYNCNNLYPDEKSLKHHRCPLLKRYKCTLCKQGFQTEDRLKFHVDFHKNKNVFCELCKKDFKFESKMYLHLLSVHKKLKDKPFCCDICGKTFEWLTLLQNHTRKHTNERPYKCNKCEAAFVDKSSLTGHLPSHEDYPQFNCDKCNYHTGRKHDLVRHVTRFHPDIQTSQICNMCVVCNEVFPNKHHTDVEDHSSRHVIIDDENKTVKELYKEIIVYKLYQCEHCERCYSSLQHLTQHRLKHENIVANMFYQCRFCNQYFNKHDLLVRHKNVHKNITSQFDSKLTVLIVVVCDVCSLEFIDYRQYLNHKLRGNCLIRKLKGKIKQNKTLVRKHLQPIKVNQLYINSSGLFECLICQRTYKNRRRFRLHLATHTDVKFKQIN